MGKAFVDLSAMHHALKAEPRALFRETFAVVRAHWPKFAIAAALVVVVAFFTLPNDTQWLRLVAHPRQAAPLRWARALTLWGDYHTGTLMLAGGLWSLGLLLKAPRLRQAGLACLLAASTAGLFANSFRGMLGRPRPMAKMEDRLHGPSLRFELQGSPSAHAATSVGSATAVLLSIPPLGGAALVGAVAVVWSRMYLRHHHPTDVFLGSAIGVMFGVAFGLGARRSVRRKSQGLTE